MQEGKFLADTFCHGDPKLVAEQTMANAGFTPSSSFEDVPLEEYTDAMNHMSELFGGITFKRPKNWKVTSAPSDGVCVSNCAQSVGEDQSTPPTVQVAYQPPVMYDIRIDNFRAVTQADWDRAERSLKMLHEFLRVVREAENKLPRSGQV